jgi:hypothetical protein
MAEDLFRSCKESVDYCLQEAIFRRGAGMLENDKRGGADVDNFGVNQFINLLGERYVKYLRCIVGCQNFDYFTGRAIRMIPHIGVMMK